MQQEWVNATIRISISGVPLEMHMTLPARPVKLRRMLPIFRAVTDSFVEMGVEAAESRNETVSCAKGCSACCRQSVPLAESEVHAIAELVEEMPEPRRRLVKERFARGVEHFRRLGWFERFEQSFQGSEEDVQKLVIEYFREGVECPFLENAACSIYEDRPLACREYLVTSAPEHCFEVNVAEIKPVNLFFKHTDILCSLSAKEAGEGLPFTPLIRALERAAESADNAAEKTGGEWAAEFFGKFKRKASE